MHILLFEVKIMDNGELNYLQPFQVIVFLGTLSVRMLSSDGWR